jgi:5-dehydro-4-deoxyglucarate dehydratase
LDPEELKSVLGSGLLSFPLTDFDAQLRFARGTYQRRLEWLMPYGASALFAAGGTGEFFSLEPDEYEDVVRAAVETCRGVVPIIAGAGGGTTLACRYAMAAERVGAQGILLMPHYLTEASQAGLVAHVLAVCRSVGLGVVIYNRGACRLTPESLASLADTCPNLIGFKDGVGDIELMVAIRRKLGERFAYLGGLPTAEVFAPAYKAMGVPVYSSAVFNFVPRTAVQFYEALQYGETATVNRLLDEFFLPYIALRNRRPGYAVSIVKAGAAIAGHPAGAVRPPLTDLAANEVEALRELVAKLGPQAISMASRQPRTVTS